MKPRSALFTIIFLAAVVAVPSQVLAFTMVAEDDWGKDQTASFCVESAPDGVSGSTVSVAVAKLRLQDAIANWEVAPDKNDNQALNLQYHSVCDYGQYGTDWTIRGGDVPNAHAETEVIDWLWYERGIITFEDLDAWWDGTDTWQTSEFSFEGVLTHEMGHAIGLGHAGNGAWTYDNTAPWTISNYPTMAQGGGEAASKDFDTIEQDDWGGAAWVSIGPSGGAAYFNANPGFEYDPDPFMHWYRSSTSQITGQSYAAKTGDVGAQFASSGNYIYMTSVYDPWIVTDSHHVGGELVLGMSNNARFALRTYYRHASAATTGGVLPMWSTAVVHYDTFEGSKTDTYVGTTPFSDFVPLQGCGDKGTAWRLCTRNVPRIFLGEHEQWWESQIAIAVRTRYQSTSSDDVYMDKTGVFDNS